MKKLLLILVVVLFAVTACEKAMYVDGTYKATFAEFDDHGWNTFLELTITEDMVSDVDFDYLDSTGNRKSTDAGYQTSMTSYSYAIVDGDTVRVGPADYTPAINASIAGAVINPDFSGLDAFAGATHSVENADVLFEAILDAALTGDVMDISVPLPAK